MSSHSPTIIQGANGLADISATFGKSVLDGEVPYPADMAGLPTSTPNPSALKRKTRRSWFETTPSGTRLEIAVEKPAPRLRKLSGEVEVLTLTHFTAAPRLDFGTMKPGQVKTCTLLLRNPHECEQNVKVEKVPEKKHFAVACKAFCVGPGESYPLEVTWSPPEPGNFREMILIQVDKSYRLQAYVLGSVTAPPQKKKKKVGLLATKVSKPFSVIQTSGLTSINKQYSPDKNRRSDETKRRSARLSGQGLRMKHGNKENIKKENVKKGKEEDVKAKNILQKKSIENKERLKHKNVKVMEDKIPKKKMRRSNTYSNVTNQGLLIPVIHGETVQGQMDTSLIDIVDKCNVSGIEALEQSLNSPSNHPTDRKNNSNKTHLVEKPSFLETSNASAKLSPDLDKIESQIILNKDLVKKETNFLGQSTDCEMLKLPTKGKSAIVNVQTLKDNDTFQDSLETGTANVDTDKYIEQPSFLSPAVMDENTKTYHLRRSARKSVGKLDGEATELKLLKSVKRRSGRRSITKEKRKSSLNHSAGSKSIIDQLKNIRTFIKEKSFEIESCDEPSFLKSDHDLHQHQQEEKREVCKQQTYVEEPSFLHSDHDLHKSDEKREVFKQQNLLNSGNLPEGLKDLDLQRDTFLANSSKMKVLETQKPSEASPRRTTFTVLRRNVVIKSPARSRSEGHKQQNILAALDEALNESEDIKKEPFDGFQEKCSLKTNSIDLNDKEVNSRKTASPKRLYSADSLEKDEFEPMFTSPKQLKLENPEAFERRSTLTVTKSRPSDALLYQMEKQTAKLFKADETSFEPTDAEVKLGEIRKIDITNNTEVIPIPEHLESKPDSSKHELSFPSTPNQLPTSPNPDHSRRSTHIVKQPRIIDLSKVEQKELFSGKDDTNEADKLADSPANNTRRRLSAKHSIINSPDKEIDRDNQSDVHLQLSNDLDKQEQPEVKAIEVKETHGLLFIPLSGEKRNKESSKNVIKPKTVVDPKQFLRKRTNAVSTASTVCKPKRIKQESTDIPVKPLPVREKKTVQENKITTKESGLKNRTVLKQKPNVVKGVAQSKLILVKKSKTALPKHPLPFAAKNMYYDERWMEKQERGFVNWLNFVLTPAEENQGNDVKVKVDAGKLAVDVAKGQIKLAPTNEVLSFRAYSASRKLNRLRKNSCRLFQSESVVKVIQKLEGEVESGRLSVRKDKMLHADLGLKQKILDMLLCYNPLWLRVGIETIYGELVPLQSNSDVFGLSRFILTRLLTSPDIIQEFAHPTVPHLYRDGYAEATANHSLKKFLMLVYFLDRAKQERLIEHNPCLFCKNSDLKTSKDVLIQFSRDYLSGEGDITRHLGYLGYKVTYTQTALDEFDFAVSKLSTDLRDGLRLTRVIEFLCDKPALSKTLRVPAISRLQKVHNVDVVLKALKQQNIETDNVAARDIVDGHREKTLRLLWNIILHYQVEILLNETQMKEEIELLEKSLKVKNQLQRFLMYTHDDRSKRESEGPDLHTQNPRLNLLLKWCRAVCAFFNIKVENFTVSFSDGRALCHIVHYYHPGLLPLDSIRNDTSMTHLEKMEKNSNRNMNASFNDSINSSAAFGDVEDPDVYESLLRNERENFKTLFEKVKELGGIPLMLKWSDMSNTIPDEKVVVTYLLYLCARLLDIRHESRAARVIQLAWRNYRVKTAEVEFEVKNRAASKIQKHVRKFLERKTAERKEKAAQLLQRVWRGHRGRKRVQQLKLEQVMVKQRQAVELLQGAIMGYLHRRRYLQMKEAVVQLQAYCRGYLLRKRRNNAATVIQSAFRSYSTRKSFKEMRASLVQIQSCVRGYIVRRNVQRYKQAVITIQRRFQAHLAMKVEQQKFKHVKKSCVVIQQYWRKYLSNWRQKQTKAAVKIQAAFRGCLERKRYVQIRSSVMVLQAAIRGHTQRKSYCQQKQAIGTIQRYFRNYMVAKQQRAEFLKLRQMVVKLQALRRMIIEKRRYQTSLTSVIKIQASIRMFVDRRRFVRMREAACTIQKYCKMYSCRRKYLICVGAAITIQAVVKGHLVRKELKRQNKAAIVLQAFIRQAIGRRKFLALKSAVTQCQRRVRANVIGHAEHHHYQRLRHAAITLQKLYRGKRCRQEYLSKRDSIMKIQRMTRMMLGRKSYIKLRTATLFVQRCYRAKKLGEKCRSELQIMSNSATIIQSAYRGHRVRKEIQRKNRAATVIQSHVKCMQQMAQYRKMKQITVLCQQRVRAKLSGACQMLVYRKLKTATITIQSVYRGYCVRKEMQKKHTAATILQSHVRCMQQMNKYQKIKRVIVFCQHRIQAKLAGKRQRSHYQNLKWATTVIQSVYRGHCVRKEIKRKQQAATIVQSHVRGMLQKQRYEKIRNVTVLCQQRIRAKLAGKQQRTQFTNLKRAAIVIQKFVRGRKCRYTYQITYSQVVKVQSVCKMFLVRSMFLRKKQAVLVLQRRFRAKQLSNMYKENYNITKQAAITLQAAFRGLLVRRELHRCKSAATCIQKYVKGHIQRKKYLQLRRAVLTVQKLHHAKVEGLKCRQQYLKLRSMAITIQSYYRGCQVRKEIKHKNMSASVIQSVYKRYKQQREYLNLKKAVISCQRRYRAKCQGMKAQENYQTVKAGVTKLQAMVRGMLCRNLYKKICAAQRIQSVYRMYKCKKDYQTARCHVIKCQAIVRGVLTRKMFNQKKKQIWAVCVLQQRWRARVQGHAMKNRFQEIQRSAKVIQTYFRSKCQADKIRQQFVVKRKSAIVIQAAVKCWIQRRQYLQQKKAAMKLQSVIRGYSCRKEYLTLKRAVIICQRQYRANIAGQKDRQRYATIRQSVVKIQSAYRRYASQKWYLSMRDATIKIQSLYRGYRDRIAYRRCHKSAIVLQTYWRAELLCRKHVFEYHAIRDATIFIQKNYRCKVARENFTRLKQATVIIQSSIRQWKAKRQLEELKHEKLMERRSLLERVVKMTKIHLAAMQIQRCYRNYCIMRVAREKLHSITLIQRWMRSKLQRLHYLKDRERIVYLQRQIRQWLVRRDTAACVIQRAVRKWLGTFEDRKRIRAATKIKAVWKGYLVRRNSTSKKLMAARQRVIEANASATEEKKLCNRTTSALDFLLRYKHMASVLDALRHLEVSTRLSWVCCERLVAVNAVPVLYVLIRSCNRSLPHMEVIKITVDIMLNLAKYEKTRASLYEEDNSVGTLLELMQIYREKGPIFIKTCTLLGIMSLDTSCKTAIIKDRKVTDKLRSIHTLTARKQKLEENQRVTRAKMNATFNTTFSLRSPVKKQKIKPDWALNKDRMKEIQTPMKAINFVLQNLGISVK